MKKIISLLLLLTISFISGCATPTNINVNMDYPNEVNVGDNFDMEFTISNVDTIEHELRSIDIGNDFLDAILISDINYKVKEEYNAFGDHIYEFRTNIDKQTDLTVVFSAKALKSGDFSGNVDFCIDGDASCLFNSIRIIIK